MNARFYRRAIWIYFLFLVSPVSVVFGTKFGVLAESIFLFKSIDMRI